MQAPNILNVAYVQNVLNRHPKSEEDSLTQYCTRSSKIAITRMHGPKSEGRKSVISMKHPHFRKQSIFTSLSFLNERVGIEQMVKFFVSR